MAREIKALLDEEVAAYAAHNPRSLAMFARAKQSLPGGNTRTGVHIDPFPLYADRGEGSYLYDIDGHRLIDFVNNNTALPLGHAHPAIVAALQEQIVRGTGFSRPLALEVEMAEALRARMPALEKMRFCSSGTEAVLNALRVARAHTGRTKDRQIRGGLSRDRRQRAGELFATAGAGTGAGQQAAGRGLFGWADGPHPRRGGRAAV